MRRNFKNGNGQSSLIILLLSICVVAIVVVFFSAITQQRSKDTLPNIMPIRPNPPEVRPEPLEPAEIVNNFKTAPLPERYNWTQQQLQLPVKDDDLDYYISYDNRYKQYVETEGVEVRNFDFSGELYKTTVTGLDDVSLEESYNVFTEAYLNSLLGLGWKYGLRYEDYYITGLSADGVIGKVRGVVKKEGDKISTVIIAASYKGLVSEPVGGGVSIECPCDVTLKVFVGEPVSIGLISAADYLE